MRPYLIGKETEIMPKKCLFSYLTQCPTSRLCQNNGNALLTSLCYILEAIMQGRFISKGSVQAHQPHM